jgi:hypothetical protein
MDSIENALFESNNLFDISFLFLFVWSKSLLQQVARLKGCRKSREIYPYHLSFKTLICSQETRPYLEKTIDWYNHLFKVKSHLRGFAIIILQKPSWCGFA